MCQIYHIFLFYESGFGIMSNIWQMRLHWFVTLLGQEDVKLLIRIVMLINVHCAKCIGIEAVPVTVEVNIDNGLGVHLVGLADAAVKESLLRTITALQSMGFRIPGKKIVINLAPADMHKKGSGYDVPIALGIIAASCQRDLPLLEEFIVMGELGLDGGVRDVPGALPIVERAGVVRLSWRVSGR